MKSSTLTASLLYIFNECRNYNLFSPSFRSEASIGAYLLGNITQLRGQFALTFYMKILFEIYKCEFDHRNFNRVY